MGGKASILVLIVAVALAGCDTLLAPDLDAGVDGPDAGVDGPVVCGRTLPDGTGAGVSAEEICPQTFCTADASCAHTLYVKQGAAGDGSETNPFGTLVEAANQAVAGDCIAVAAGSYARTSLEGGVSLLGAGARYVTIGANASLPGLSIGKGKGGLLRGFAITGPGPGMVVRQVDDLRVEDVRVASVHGVAIDAREVQRLALRHAHVKTVAVMGASTPDSGPPDAGADGGGGASIEYGIGILVAEGSTVEIERVFVEASGTQGVLVHGSSAQVKDSVVTESGLFGVAFDCSGGCSGPGSEIIGSQISKNNGLGVVVLGGEITAKNNSICMTRYKAGFARNIHLQDGAQIHLERNTVHGSKAQGVVIHNCTGTLLENTVHQSEERGIVLQSLNGLTLDDNDLDGNARSGITVLSSKAVTIKNGRVADTSKRAVIVDAKSGQVGDGIQVLAQSVVSISGLKVEGNGRAGILVDNARATLKDTSITGSDEALVVQNAEVSDQEISNVTDASGNAIVATTPTTPYITSSTELVGPAPLSPLPPLPLPPP